MPPGEKIAASESIVLLVEDNPDEAFLMAKAWTKVGVGANLVHFKNGKQALQCLKKRQGNIKLIMLDLNMPLMDGFETFKWIRTRPYLSEIPVLMLTSSVLEKDKTRAQSLGITSFIVKPASWTGLLSLVERLSKQWLPKA